MDSPRLAQDVDRRWDQRILPTLTEYVRIPNESPAFDPEWEAHGHMEKAVGLVADWCRETGPPGLQLEVVRLPGRTPLVLMELPGSVDDTVLLYGHLDKQPPMTGWAEGLGPWTPVLRDGRLYGRGGADDGYAAFASVAALAALAEQGLPHARCVILIEACEESGSTDLPAYIDALRERIGTPSLVICLDSGCGNYEQLWSTTSLRGMVVGDLHVQVLTEGVHSGDAGGIVPDSFRLARVLLSRLEDATTGALRLPELEAVIPGARRDQAAHAAAQLGGRASGRFPWAGATRPAGSDETERVLARTWRPALAITGQSGLPDLRSAGNVLRPETALRLSLRLPPTADGAAAGAAVKAALEAEPPQGALVRFELLDACTGWDAPPLAPWLERAVERASQACFGQPACSMGEGGTIPFMGMLGERFPEAQFLITGVLGPGSNAHGPNEFLEIATARRLTACVAHVLVDHARRTAD